MPQKLRLSAPMKRVLRQVAAGGNPDDHCKTQSDYGGLQGTIRALVVRGLMTWEFKLTRAGRALAKTLT